MTRYPILGTWRILHTSMLAAGLFALGLLAACGQRGNLVLPTEPAAQNRATLPQVLLPLPRSNVSNPAGTASPAPPALPSTPPASSTR